MIYAGLDSRNDFSAITTINTQGKEMVKRKKVPNNSEINNLPERDAEAEIHG